MTAVQFLESAGLFSLFLLCGLLACGFLALVWWDTRHDDRSEMEDTAPQVQKVVQFTGKRIYTDADYRELVDRVTKGENADDVIARIDKARDDAHRDLKDGLERRRAYKERA